jgi:hypothetical protein
MVLAVVESGIIAAKTSGRLPSFCRKTFAQAPLATSLPQDSLLALMFEPCAKRRSGAVLRRVGI